MQSLWSPLSSLEVDAVTVAGASMLTVRWSPLHRASPDSDKARSRERVVQEPRREMVRYPVHADHQGGPEHEDRRDDDRQHDDQRAEHGGRRAAVLCDVRGIDYAICGLSTMQSAV